MNAIARAPVRPAISPTRRPLRWLGAACLLAALFLGPSYLDDGDLSLAFTLLVSMALAQAWNLIGGYGGQFSLAHGMFVGIGSYTVAILLVRTDVPQWLAIPIAGLVAAAIAAVTAIPLFRLRGVYFAVGSLGVALAALAWMINWEFTNKTSSYSLPASAFLGFEMQYYMAGALAAVASACVACIVASRFGLRLMAVRDDEDAALELGVNSFAVKTAAFALSAFFVGVGGALIAMQKLALEPYSAFSLTFTIDMVVATVVGGLGTIVGPLLGAAVMFALRQWLEQYTDWSTLILGIALILIIRIAPGGLVGLGRTALARARGRERLERRPLRSAGRP